MRRLAGRRVEVTGAAAARKAVWPPPRQPAWGCGDAAARMAGPVNRGGAMRRTGPTSGGHTSLGSVPLLPASWKASVKYTALPVGVR